MRVSSPWRQEEKARPGSRCRCLARTLSLSYCRSIGGPDLHPTPLSSLDTEFQPLMKALCLQASMACIDIRLQKRPNPARDCLTKLCRQSLSQPAALLGCAMGHQDRAAVAVGHERALAKPSLWPVVAAGVPSVGRGRLGRLPRSAEAKSRSVVPPSEPCRQSVPAGLNKFHSAGVGGRQHIMLVQHPSSIAATSPSPAISRAAAVRIRRQLAGDKNRRPTHRNK
jgi:hypothetical protein